jgi:hypothetical protein
MSFTVYQLLLKTSAILAATCTNCTAVVSAEHFAELVSFQWHQPGFPPTQNVNSAVSRELSARQFSGSIA